MTSPVSWASWGPQFCVQARDPGDASWSWLADLPRDPHLLAARVDQALASLAAMGGADAPEVRVAASLAQMTLVGRLVAVSVGLAVHGLDASALLRGEAWWRPEPGLVFPVALAQAPVAASAEPSLRGSVVEELTETMVRDAGVPPRVAWGNVAATLQATVRTVARVSPEHGVVARSACASLLDHPGIPAAEQVLAGQFRRSSCCLLYRASPGHAPVCGDCVLGMR